MRQAAIQQAFYTRLNDVSITASLSTAYSPLVAIFTNVPQGAPEDDARFPFIIIGPITETPFDTINATGTNAIVQVTLYSRGTMLAHNTLADAIDTRLRRQPLSGLIGHVTTELESAASDLETDGRTNQTIMLFRVLVKP